MSKPAASAWRIDPTRHAACLDAAELQGVVDLLNPHAGFQLSRVRACAFPRQRVLGVELDVSSADEIEECYVRVNDLVATYRASDERPLRVQAYWRRVEPLPAGALAALDLQVSVQTHLLDQAALLSACSFAAGSEFSRLIDADAERWSHNAANVGAIELLPSDGTGCLAIESTDGDGWFVEMIHPADFVSARIEPVEGGWQWRRQLFAERLEKGVILRGRVRCLWMPGDFNGRAILAAYQHLSAEEPPLTV